MDPKTYAKAGVDIRKEGSAISSILKGINRAVGKGRKGMGGLLELRNGFAGLIDFGHHALSLCTDGVGSKIIIARATGKYDTVGIDCIAMNVNDMICLGVEPVAFVDYLAVEQMDDEVAEQIGIGLGRGAELSNLNIIGGESATLPDIVTGFDLAGTALGFAKKDDIITGDEIEDGDVVVGLESSGLHSNGFTLVRNVVTGAGFDYKDPLPKDYLDLCREMDFGTGYDNIGSMLLEPTRIYVREVLSLLKSHRESVHGIANITGGGLRNLVRLNPGFDYKADDIPVRNPVFPWIQKRGNIETGEMYQTFNMGLGMALVVEEGAAEEVIEALKRQVDYQVWRCGRVSKGGGRVTYEKKGIAYEEYL